MTAIRFATWNVYNRASDSRRLLEFLAAHRPDVACLQELTAAHVATLRGLEGYRLVTAADFLEDGQPSFLGVLSRLPMSDHRVTVHNAERALSPSWLGRRMRWRECLESHSVLLRGERWALRILNLHLSCAAPPSHRRAELEAAIAPLDPREPLVIAGDFNSFARWPINLAVGWAFGYRVADYACDERRAIAGFAARGGLQQPLRAAVTLPKLRLHLDRVLVRGVEARHCAVDPRTYGSDHRPLAGLLSPGDVPA